MPVGLKLDPPVSSKSAETKSLNSSTVGDVIVSCGDAEIDGVIAKLEMAECDVLMKYLYKVSCSEIAIATS